LQWCANSDSFLAMFNFNLHNDVIVHVILGGNEIQLDAILCHIWQELNINQFSSTFNQCPMAICSTNIFVLICSIFL
jgi:hypothetical protein